MTGWLVTWILPIVIRYAVTLLSGYLIKKGWGANIDWAQIGAGIAGFIGSLGWAVHESKTPQKVATRLARLGPDPNPPEGHSQPQV